jgi:predicted AAA+ superfamily ATPase
MYIPREIERTVDEMLGQFKVVLVTGARQVGKTTMLEEHLGKGYGYVSLEDQDTFAQAGLDSTLFFQMNALPLVIDEVQRVPGLFQAVKAQVDKSAAKGRVILTGSQTYELMHGVSESLAGRVGILEMSGLSLRELSTGEFGREAYVPRVMPGRDGVPSAKGHDIWEVMQRGSMPALWSEDVPWDHFWANYVRTYLERDVRALVNVRDEQRFYDFMVACAARSAQLFNASDIADVVGVDYKTVQSWVSILQASGIVRILRPIWANPDKRLAKTPKIYFMDTGLVCYLTRWTTPEQLRRGAVAGHVFETFAVSEALKSYMNAGADLRDVWFYRDAKKREVDLVIQEGRVLHPVEVKMAATVGPNDVRSFRMLEGLGDYEVGFGHVICQTPEPYMVTRDVQAVSAWDV